MVLVIGEIAEEYRQVNGDEYRRVLSGTGLEWAVRIEGSYLLTILGSDNASHDISAYLEGKGIRYSCDLISSLPSAVPAAGTAAAGCPCPHRGGCCPFPLPAVLRGPFPDLR